MFSYEYCEVFKNHFWTLDVSWTVPYEITSVCLNDRLSVCPPVTEFSQDWIISDILHDDSWPWYLVNFGGPNLGSICLHQAQNEVFHDFLEFGSYFYPEIAYNDSFRQCITSSRGKTHEWTKWAKIGPKIRFFAIFSSLVQYSTGLWLGTMSVKLKPRKNSGPN